MALTFDPDSIAGQRLTAVQRVKSYVLWNMYGHTAFGIVTDDASAIGLGSRALSAGRSGAVVAGYLADYLAMQEARKAKALKDKRNAAARARRAKKKQEQSGE